MGRTTKIVHIGAASLSFGCGALADAIHTPELRGSKLVLVDIDEKHLELQYRLAKRLNEESGAGLIIERTTDRREALLGAEYVLCSVATKRNDLWKLDWSIPLKHGLQQVLGENGGPGGLSHALRNIPLILDICRDIEELCPEALLMNFSNPESRLCLAVSRYTKVKAVGLCHGVFMGRDIIADVLGVDRDRVEVKAAGLNHFLWVLDARDTETGEDIYPRFKEAMYKKDDTFMPLTRHMLETYGYLAAPSDDHIGEYLPEAWEMCAHHGYDFDGADRWYESHWSKMPGYASGELPVDHYLSGKSGEIAFDIIAARLNNKNMLAWAVNVPNDGSITNLPNDCIVEVPAVISGNGINPLCMGDLPSGIAALCRQQAAVQDLVVEAAVKGDRNLALQALLIDPVVKGDHRNAKAALDELLSVHAQYLPRFC